ARVPTGYRSSAPGSSVSAERWATSTIRLSASIACSSARMDFSRPTNSGITMCGNTTTSRSGRTGRTADSARSVMLAPFGAGAEAPAHGYGATAGGMQAEPVTQTEPPRKGAGFQGVGAEWGPSGAWASRPWVGAIRRASRPWVGSTGEAYSPDAAL